MEPLTVIFFSCRRLDLLKQSVWAFVQHNTYPVTDFIIVNDSADEKIHQQLKNTYENVKFVFNEKNVGLIHSVDLGYEHIKTEYLFHCEDDWQITRGGFIEKALKIMRDPRIEEVWLGDYNGHPLDKEILNADGIEYQLAQENFQRGKNGFNNNAWHGFTTACALKRLSDYKKVAPYHKIPWQGTIWHREQAIGEEYHKLGYRTAVLTEWYARNIGYGQSEYITGLER